MRIFGRNSRIQLIVSIVFIGLLLFVVYAFRSSFDGAFSYIQRPFASAGTWIRNHTPNLDQDKQARIETLESQVQSLSVDRAKLSSLEEENRQLRDQLGFISRSDLQARSAHVIARSQDSQRQTFVIDRGKAQGIRIGNAVIVGNGILLGKISEVRPSSATVTTTTDATHVTAISVLNETRTIGIAEGMSGNLIRLRFIPQDEEISVNDLVVTSGGESGIPPGLVVGIVNSVTSDEKEPFKEAIVEPVADANRQIIVTVLLKDAL